MDFAADAVVDVMAPPTRAAAARAAIDPEAGTSFEEHLQATAPEADLNKEAGAAPSDQVEEQPAGEASAPQIGAHPPAPTPIATVVAVQLIAAPQAPHQGQPAPPAGAAAPSLPMQPVAEGQSAITPPPAPAETTRSAHGKENAATSAKTATPMDAPPSAAAPPAGAPALLSASAVQQGAAPAASPPNAPPPAASEAIQIVAPTAAPAPIAAVAEHAARQPKATHAQADAKSDAPAGPERGAAPAPVASTANAAAKAAAPQSAAKSALPLLAAEPIDAPQQNSSASVSASTHASHAQQAASEQVAVRAAPAAHQVAREIVRRFDGGSTRFELRLDPPELGRVEVRLDVSRDQRVTAVISADSPQALTELARHARELEQMLQGAGLELSENGLSFDLRQNSESGEMERTSASMHGEQAPADEPPPVAARPLGYERWRGVRVDMMV